MANVVLSSKNALDSGVSWYGQADASFPLTNLADGNFSKQWRYTPGTNADGNTARFAFSLNPVLRASHVAFCAHTLGEHAQIRVKAGMARFDFDATTDNPLIHDITFGGGTNGTRTNEYGTMVAGTCPRYEHDRRYFDNGFKYAEDLSQSDWLESGGAKKYSDGKTVDFAAAGAKVYQAMPQLYNDTYEERWQVRLLSGDGQFAYEIYNGTSNVTGATQTATTDWQWLSSSLATGAETTAGTAGVKKISAAGVLQFRKAQISRGTSGGRYRKTTTQRRYQCIGVINEAAATNSLLHSADLTNPAWVKSAGATVTTNTAVAPDGTTTMDRVAFTAAADNFYQDLSFGGTTSRAASKVFRKDGSTLTSCDLTVTWQTGGVSGTVRLTFNPSTAAFVSSGATGSATLRAANVKDLGGGFYLAYAVGVGTDAANTVVRTQITAGAAGNLTAWGFQNEASFFTTHIPTTTAAVTRTVDTAAVAAGFFSGVWNAGEGTIYHEAMIDEVLSGQNSQASFILATGTAGNVVQSQIYDLTTAVAAQFYVEAGAVAQATLGVGSLSRGVAQRIASRYRANDIAASFNGAAAVTDAVASIPTITSIDLMYTPGPTAYLRRVTIWPTGKSNTELASLATSGPSAIDYDSGWDDVLQMSMAGDVPSTWGKDYDIVKTFTARSVEWVRVEMYDGAKTSSSFPFDIGRAFMGKLTFQPASNAEYGLGDSWIERSTFTETRDGRRFFNDAARIREVAFSLPFLTLAEGKKLHEIHGSGGTSSEVLYLQDPGDEAECQRTGFVGLMEKLDPLAYPLVNTRAMSFQIRKKR